MNRRDLVKFAALLPFFPKTNNQPLNDIQYKEPVPVQKRPRLEQKYIQNVVCYNADPKHDQLLDEKFMGRIESLIRIPEKIHGLWQKDVNNFRIHVSIALNDIDYNQKPADQSKQLMEAIEKAADQYHENWDYSYRGPTGDFLYRSPPITSLHRNFVPWYELHQGVEEQKFFIALARNEKFQCGRTIKGLVKETDLPEDTIQQIVNKYQPHIVQENIGYDYWEVAIRVL